MQKYHLSQFCDKKKPALRGLGVDMDDLLKDAPAGIQALFGQPANMEWLLMVINATVAQRDRERAEKIRANLAELGLVDP